jgi:hypothetical protein
MIKALTIFIESVKVALNKLVVPSHKLNMNVIFILVHIFFPDVSNLTGGHAITEIGCFIHN